MVASGTNHVSQAVLAIVKKEMEKSGSEKDILEVIKKERGRYSPIHDTKADSECFNDSLWRHLSTTGRKKWDVNLAKYYLNRKITRIY